jgi:hypothetical protein
MRERNFLSFSIAAAAFVVMSTPAAALGFLNHGALGNYGALGHGVVSAPSYTVHHSPAVYADVPQTYVVNQQVKVQNAQSYVTTTPAVYGVVTEPVVNTATVAVPSYTYGHGYYPTAGYPVGSGIGVGAGAGAGLSLGLSVSAHLGLGVGAGIGAGGGCCWR